MKIDKKKICTISPYKLYVTSTMHFIELKKKEFIIASERIKEYTIWYITYSYLQVNSLSVVNLYERFKMMNLL